jgi:hypothetical protein
MGRAAFSVRARRLAGAKLYLDSKQAELRTSPTQAAMGRNAGLAEALTLLPGYVEQQTDALLDRIVEASCPAVVAAYEARIDKLERQKIRLREQAEQIVPPKGRLEEFIEKALAFLASPWNLYEKDEFSFKRTVLKLAFAEPLRYSRNEGYRTAEITFPFKVLADISTQECGLVEPRGVEPLTSAVRLQRSPN